MKWTLAGRVLLCASLAVLGACNGSDSSTPIADASASVAVSGDAHDSGVSRAVNGQKAPATSTASGHAADATGSSTASVPVRLPRFRLGFVYQAGVINPDGTVSAPNIPQIPWSKYTYFAQANIYPQCASSTSLPAVNSKTLDAVPGSWRKSFSKMFTTSAHAASKPALVSLIGTGGADWINATGSAEQTQLFVAALLAYVNSNQYDGIDIDMEANPPDAQHLAVFFKTLNASFKDASKTWNGQPLLITADTLFDKRALNNSIYMYVDKLNEMTYDMQSGSYANKRTHPWHSSAVRRDTSSNDGHFYGGNPLTFGYGGSSYGSMDENIWYETYFYDTPYSAFTAGISFYGATIQGPRLGTAGATGSSRLTDLFDSFTSSSPFVSSEVPFGRLLTPGSLMASSVWTDQTDSTPGWDNTTKASYIVHDVGRLPSYVANDPYDFGPAYMSDGGAAQGALSDAFVSYPSIRFIQEAVKWANELKPGVSNEGAAGYDGQQAHPGYLGGIFVWTVLADYLPDQTGDNRYPLSTALAEAQDLNAWTYTAPVWDGDTSVWQIQVGSGSNVASQFDDVKLHRVTNLAAAMAASDVSLLSGPPGDGGSADINDSIRTQYFRFAMKSTEAAAPEVIVNVRASDGHSYSMGYDCAGGGASFSASTQQIVIHLSTLCDGTWHSHARDLLADLRQLAPAVTSISLIESIKVRLQPVMPAAPVSLDDFTLFEAAPPLGDF